MACASTSVSLTFRSEDFEEESRPNSERLSLILDDERNKVVKQDADTGETTTSYPSEFCYGNRAYFLLLRSDRETPVVLETSWGDTKLVKTGDLFYLEDQISFAHSKKGNLTYKPSGGVETRWFGRDPGTTIKVLPEAREVELGKVVTGVLDAYYNTLCDVYQITAPGYDGGAGVYVSPMPCLITAIQGDLTASLTVNFKTCDDEEEEDEAATGEYEVIAVNGCGSGDPIPYATVIFDGVTYSTGADGIVSVGTLTGGSTHTGRARAPGFQESQPKTFRI